MSPIVVDRQKPPPPLAARLTPKRCMAIGLARSSVACSSPSTLSSSPSSSSGVGEQHAEESTRNHADCSPTLHSFTSSTESACLCHQSINCVQLFNEFVRENSNQTLSSGTCSGQLCKLDLVGYLYPSTLLISGSEQCLESLATLWSKRILRSPPGYYIRFVGNTSALEVATISQSHFTPLAEALYKCIDELNQLQLEATFDSIVKRLLVEFPSMELPNEDILKASLNTMLTETRLLFDSCKQVYYTNRGSRPLTPWDEFENLSISDNKDKDDIELEYKSVNTDTAESGKCAHFDGIFYMKSKTLSTEASFAEFSDEKKLLRRNSSLSGEIHKYTSAEAATTTAAANFKRSKSFKLTYKEEGEQVKKCTCNEIIIKRQSLLSKLLKFGHSNGHSKARHSFSSSSSSSVKNANFGAQFPENSGGEIEFNESESRQSRATQTVKSGPEDIVTVIMKQAGKHALVRRPSADHHRTFRQSERSSSEGCCRFGRQCKCENGMPFANGKLRETRSNNSRRYRNRAAAAAAVGCAECTECYKCQLNEIQIDIVPNQRPQREGKHRKHRSSSLRYHQRPNFVFDSNGHSYSHHHHQNGHRPRRKGMGGKTESDDEDLDDELYHHHREDNGKRLQLYRLDDLNRIRSPNNELFNKLADFEQEGCGGQSATTTNGLLINNSLNLKIEIETSNLSPANGGGGPVQPTKIRTINSCHRPEVVSTNAIQDSQSISRQVVKVKDVEPRPFNGRHFANDIYSELHFEAEPASYRSEEIPITTTTTGKQPLFGNHHEIDYANSIAALKEHLARAKANFFNSPLSPST